MCTEEWTALKGFYIPDNGLKDSKPHISNVYQSNTLKINVVDRNYVQDLYSYVFFGVLNT